MENANEKSASLSFLSAYPTCWSTNQSTGPSDLDNLNLRKQNTNPEEPLLDAEIIVDGKSVAVNRGILSAHSQFFYGLFYLGNDGSVSEGKPKYLMTDLVPYRKVGYEAFNDILHCLYTGKPKASPLEVATCVDDACAHEACSPAINYVIELMYASAAFKMTQLVSVYEQHRLRNFVEKALVEDVIPILVAASHYHLNPLRSYCIQRIARSNLDDVCLEKELPDEVSSEIKSLRAKSNQESEANIKEVDPERAKRVRSIHNALDFNDFELLNILLEKFKVTLDDAYALHYAAAYCNPEVFKEVLNMGSAQLNLKDARGQTVLHVAARRKEPAVMETLLRKGACASETTSDGLTAVAICRRMTRRKDYFEAHEARLCIDILEREMRSNSMSGNLAVSSEVMDDDFQMKLDYLENKVACVKLLPGQARTAMKMAGEDTPPSFRVFGQSRQSGSLKEVDCNETPSMQAKRCQLRLLTLLKTVETGQRYFPHFSEVIQKFMDCYFPHCPEVVDEFLDYDWSHASFLEKGTDEQKLKRARFMQVKEDVKKAICKDKAYHNRFVPPSSVFYLCLAENNRSGMPTSSASSN